MEENLVHYLSIPPKSVFLFIWRNVFGFGVANVRTVVYTDGVEEGGDTGGADESRGVCVGFVELERC